MESTYAMLDHITTTIYIAHLGYLIDEDQQLNQTMTPEG